MDLPSLLNYDNLTKTDKALLATSSAGLLGDWKQTNAHTNADPWMENGVTKKYYEQNPLLGSRPSNRDVNKYFGTALVANGLLAHAPPKYRRLGWGAITAAQVAQMIKNKRLGIGFKF